MRRAFGLLLLATLPAIAAETCVDCHAGAAERSYALSKHGVIARLAAAGTRQRAPDCGACHAVEAKAPAPAHYANPQQRAAAREQAASACGRCHSARYVTAQLAAAQRALVIGEMKQREAEAVVETARREMIGDELARIEKMLATLRDQDLPHLRLGLAHQSPDYQWWLGQAALDGRLVQIKGALGDARRRQAANPTPLNTASKQ